MYKNTYIEIPQNEDILVILTCSQLSWVFQSDLY